MPDENLPGHWSDHDLYPHDPEYSDLVLRADGTGWTYWCSWSGAFTVVRLRWREAASGVLEVRPVRALSGTWSSVDGVARHEADREEPLDLTLTLSYLITGDPPALVLDRPIDEGLTGTRFALASRVPVDPLPQHG